MRILNISCSYFPSNIGGTEVYVHNLSQELSSRGHEVFISYIGSFHEKGKAEFRRNEYVYEGIPVLAIERNSCRFRTAEIYCSVKSDFYRIFREYLHEIKPEVIHFHHISPAYSLAQMEVAREMKIPVILTYHSPTITCAHSDLLYHDDSVCGGKIDHKACLVCFLTKYKIPLLLARGWSNLPGRLAHIIANLSGKLKFDFPLTTFLQLPWFFREEERLLNRSFEMTSHFVAVSQWVYNLLLRNNIPPQKITLCRQGVGRIPQIVRKHKDSRTLTIGSISRIHRHKGIDLLIKAFTMIPAQYNIELLIYGSFQTQADRRYYLNLRRQSEGDKRIKWLGLLPDKERFQALSELDVLTIPSRWLESGPLVLLEAWAVGTPVIGSRLGGLAELIEDGKGGLLFESENAGQLAKIIIGIYKEDGLLERIKAGIPKVRLMQEVADEMEDLYRNTRGI
ncbi:MAG TPA: glycosyltransferase [Candidatus Margulisiibacteriota bacterium]|nr:glycosyltransferase [Candidatus Margulisiibacteriota bacterium]